jgi:hypothetical protein
MLVLQMWQGEWSQKTFPTQCNTSLIEHLRRELKELEESGDPEEAADCFLLLLSYAHVNGFDLFEAAVAKYWVNQTRQWGKPDEQGVVEHVRDGGAA